VNPLKNWGELSCFKGLAVHALLYIYKLKDKLFFFWYTVYHDLPSTSDDYIPHGTFPKSLQIMIVRMHFGGQGLGI
jgi:hypothetical protein